MAVGASMSIGAAIEAVTTAIALALFVLGLNYELGPMPSRWPSDAGSRYGSRYLTFSLHRVFAGLPESRQSPMATTGPNCVFGTGEQAERRAGDLRRARMGSMADAGAQSGTPEADT